MADNQYDSSTLPLDQKVWQAWVEKNRLMEEDLNGKFRRWGIIAGAGVVGVVLFWLAHRP